MIKLVFGILIGVPALMMLIFTVQNYLGASAELEPTAANMFLLVTGIPGLVLLVISAALIRSYVKGAKTKAVSAGARFCQACGAQMAPEAVFCAKCGVEQRG